MADSNDRQQPNRHENYDDANEPKAHAAAAGASAGVRMPQDVSNEQAVKMSRGGEQEDQIAGETQKGAHNNEMRGANRQGNKPDRNQSARQEGDEF